MANITITELEELKVVKSTDSILVENEVGTYKTSKANLLKETNDTIAGVQSDVNDLQTDVNAVKQDSDANNKTVADMKAEMDRIVPEVDKNNGIVENYATDIKEVKDDISANNALVNKLNSSVNSMKTDVDANNKTVADMKTDLDEAINNNGLHRHDNLNCLNNLGDSANMLTYKGKVVVNTNEYSFKTLPRKKAPVDAKYISCDGGRLPWQEK